MPKSYSEEEMAVNGRCTAGRENLSASVVLGSTMTSRDKSID